MNITSATNITSPTRNVTDATSRRLTARRIRWPCASALLVAMLGGIGGIMPEVGAHAGTAIQALTSSAFGPVFTVAALQRAVAYDPRRWRGRTVQVRGILIDTLVRLCPGDPVCVGQLTLVDAAHVGAVERLPLQWGGPDPLRAAVHRLPLLGRLVPLAQEPHWGTLQTYLVRVDAAPNTPCGGAICYSAVLLDVAHADMCYWRHNERPPFLCAEP